MLIQSPLPPTPIYPHKIDKESKGYQDRRIFPRPYTPTPPIYKQGKAKPPTSTATSRDTSDQQGQHPHPTRRPQHLRNHTNTAKKKNKATQSRQPATPKTQTPRTAWGTPTRAYPPPKTPAIEIAGGKQTNNENARHKDTLMIGRTSPNFF